MPTISFRLSDSENDQLTSRAEEEGVSVSDYIRATLGLRGLGLGDVHGDGQVWMSPERFPEFKAGLAAYDERLRVLEAKAGVEN